MIGDRYRPRLDVRTLTSQPDGTKQRTVALQCKRDSDDESAGDRRGFPVTVDVTADSIEELEQKKHLLGYLASGVSEVSA